MICSCLIQWVAKAGLSHCPKEVCSFLSFRGRNYPGSDFSH